MTAQPIGAALDDEHRVRVLRAPPRSDAMMSPLPPAMLNSSIGADDEVERGSICCRCAVTVSDAM